MDNALDGGQPDPNAREIILPVEALERRKQAVHLLGIKTSSIVADVENASVIRVLQGAKLDPRTRHLAGVFPGVRQQILQHDVHERLIADHTQPVGDAHADPSA